MKTETDLWKFFVHIYDKIKNSKNLGHRNLHILSLKFNSRKSRFLFNVQFTDLL